MDCQKYKKKNTHKSNTSIFLLGIRLASLTSLGYPLCSIKIKGTTSMAKFKLYIKHGSLLTHK